MLMIFYVFEKARATTRRVVNVVVLAPSWGDPSQPQRDVAAQGAGRGPVPPLRPNPHHGYFRGGGRSLAVKPGTGEGTVRAPSPFAAAPPSAA